MRNNLRLYHTMTAQICKWLPGERITRVRNLALFPTGLYLSRKVHLSLIAEEWHPPGKIPSLVNRLRRFLDNPRVSVRDYYRPVAESLLSAFRGLPMRLVIDTTKLGFNARLLTVSTAYRKRALPLAWSVHRGQRGWVATRKQIALLRQVAELIPKGSEVWLLGDCEFQHVPLLSWLVTDQAATWRTIRTYKIRMWIEEMYGDMKGHGFDLEATYMQDPDRLSRLVLGICLVYVWLIALGSWVVKNGKRHLVDRKDRRDKSYFRLGWSWLKRCLAQGQSLRLRFAPYGPK
jgi:hypothetical protein